MSSAFACVIGHCCKDLCSREFILAGIALARSFAGLRMTTATVMLRRHLDSNEEVALMMRQLGAKPLAADFHVFLVGGPREGAAAH